jgi:2-haloacid dehalogenase
MKLEKPSCIVLDVGDTLLHIQKSPANVYHSILEKHGFLPQGIALDQLYSVFRIAMKEMNSKPNPDHRDRYVSHPEGNDGWWKELIFRFLQKINPEIEKYPSDEVFAEIFAVFDDLSTWRIEKGFPTLLEYCKRESISLGIISNWDLRLRDILTRLELVAHFQFILISAEFGYEKPSFRIFEQAEKLSDCKGDRLVYVGDKPDLDYYPPRQRGWRSYLISKEPKGGLDCIHTLSDLVDLV